jgi:hypothetical protein
MPNVPKFLGIPSATIIQGLKAKIMIDGSSKVFDNVGNFIGFFVYIFCPGGEIVEE